MKTSSHLVRRRIEAEMVGRIYGEMIKTMDRATALDILRRVIEAAAYEEGVAFRKAADGKPGLDHFKTIVDHWGDAMELADVRETPQQFRFNVIGCHYITSYEKIGLPPELVRLLSCARDAPFAKGYGIDFCRTQTLADGGTLCDFCYTAATGDRTGR